MGTCQNASHTMRTIRPHLQRRIRTGSSLLTCGKRSYQSIIVHYSSRKHFKRGQCRSSELLPSSYLQDEVVVGGEEGTVSQLGLINIPKWMQDLFIPRPPLWLERTRLLGGLSALKGRQKLCLAAQRAPGAEATFSQKEPSSSTSHDPIWMENVPRWPFSSCLTIYPHANTNGFVSPVQGSQFNAAVLKKHRLSYLRVVLLRQKLFSG